MLQFSPKALLIRPNCVSKKLRLSAMLSSARYFHNSLNLNLQEYQINKTVRIPKSQMYDVIGDVEKYPEFVPYCTECIITDINNPINESVSPQSHLASKQDLSTSEGIDEFNAHKVGISKPKETKVLMKIKWNQYEDGFESHVLKTENEIHSWATNSDMFTELKCLWSVNEINTSNCNVGLRLIYNFQNPLYNYVSKGAGKFISKAMINAFLTRATKLHIDSQRKAQRNSQ